MIHHLILFVLKVGIREDSDWLMSSISHCSSPITSCLLLSMALQGNSKKRTANDEINGILRISQLLSFDFQQKWWNSTKRFHMTTPPQTPKKWQWNTSKSYITLQNFSPDLPLGRVRISLGILASWCWQISQKKTLMIYADSKILPSRLKIISSSYLACLISSVIFRGKTASKCAWFIFFSWLVMM